MSANTTPKKPSAKGWEWPAPVVNLVAVAVILLLLVGIREEMRSSSLDSNFWSFWTTTSQTQTPSAAKLPPGVIVRKFECGIHMKPLPDDVKLVRVEFIVPPCDGSPTSAVTILDPDKYLRMKDQDARTPTPKENTYKVEMWWDEERAQNGIPSNQWVQWASGSKYQTSTGAPNLPDKIRFVNPSQEEITVVVNFD